MNNSSSPQLAGNHAGPRVGALRLWIFAAASAAAAVALFAAPPLRQDPAYHAFADGRPFAGVPNAANALSNLAFLAVGWIGWRVARRPRTRFLDARERAAWTVLFVGVMLTSAGSAFYHLAPTNASLVLDRLPMTVGFMGLLSAVMTERLGLRGGARVLVPLVAAGAASVVWWYATELHGAGDLRPYYFVQGYPLVAILLLLAIAPPRYTGAAWLLVALALYAVAKVFEALDIRIFAATRGVVSGHTLKHLVAACAVGAIVWMLARREAARPTATESSP